MTIKITFFFEIGTQFKSSGAALPGRDAGWTESFYFDGTDLLSSSLINAAQGYVGPRTALLSNQAFMTGVRFHNLANNATRPYPFGTRWPGSAGDTASPYDCLLVRFYAANGQNTRVLEMHGIPASWLSTGELIPGTPPTAAFRSFGNYCTQNFQMQGVNKSFPHFSVDTVGTSGVVLLNEDQSGLMVGQTVQFYRTKFDDKCCGGVGQFVVGTVGTNSLILSNWSTGKTASGGTVGRWTAPAPLSFDQSFNSKGVPNGYQCERLTNRKIGRPFDLFSGRRSRACCSC